MTGGRRARGGRQALFENRKRDIPCFRRISDPEQIRNYLAHAVRVQLQRTVRLHLAQGNSTRTETGVVEFWVGKFLLSESPFFRGDL
jgi:hypothetical protein